MKKILISNKKNLNLLNKLFYDIIYIYPNNNLKDKKLNEKVKYIPLDTISLRDNFISENIAANLSKEIIDEYIGNIPVLFENKENYNFVYWDIRKYISLEISKYSKCEFLADKILKNKNYQNYKIFLDFDNVDHTVLKFLIRKQKIKYSIPLLSKIKSLINTTLRRILSFFYIILFPELNFFSCKNLSKIKKSYKVGYNLFEDQIFDDWFGSPDFFLKHNNFDRKDVIYAASHRLQFTKTATNKKRKWIKDLEKKKYNLIYINKISELISKRNYLKNIYPNVKKIRNFFLKNLKILNLLNINAVNIMFSYNNWKIFYELFSVKNFFSQMIFGENITNYVQSKNSNSTNFIYYSTTGDILDKRPYSERTEWIQYSYHKYDNFFGTKLSYQQFTNYENIFNNFYETGNIASNKILNAKKNEIYRKLNLPFEKKIISFFDDTWAINGTQNFLSYEDYLSFIINISEDNHEYCYVFKSKKNFDYYLKNANEKILEKIFKIKNSKNINFFYGNLQRSFEIDTHELISISEICIFAPMSSLSYDALCSKKKSIIYDPDKIYNNEIYINTMSDLMYAQDHSELLNLINFWKNADNDYMVDILNNRYIKPYIDKYCDNNSIERFIKYLT